MNLQFVLRSDDGQVYISFDTLIGTLMMPIPPEELDKLRLAIRETKAARQKLMRELGKK